MNRKRATELKAVLSEVCPDADADVTPGPNGAKIIISGHVRAHGVSGPPGGTDMKLRISDGVPLMRFLMTGHAE